MNKTILLALPLVGLAFACSSVEDQTLAETSEEELREVCEDNRDGFLTTENEGLIRGSCVAGLAAQEGLCTEENVASCIESVKEGTEGGDEPTIDCASLNKGDVSDCDITVGEWLDCMEAITAKYDGYANLSCDDADQFDTDVPAACTDLADRCPQIVGSEESGG